jgi:ABC-type antimicrobial peptide transport system permease subunit
MELNQDKPHEEIQQDQIAEYHADIRQIELEGYELGVKKARNALFWTAALLVIWQVIAIARQEGDFETETLLYLVPFIIGFIILGVWTKHKPYTAIVIC